MIFVTVGGQKPFDRLVGSVDEWVAEQGLERDAVLAQIGDAAAPPSNIEWTRSLEPADYKACVEKADVIVAHAGMGTILTAIDTATPILVMPRLARLGEHRNDHQLATARQLADLIRLPVAWDATELRDWLGRLDEVEPRSTQGESVRALIEFVRAFIEA